MEVILLLFLVLRLYRLHLTSCSMWTRVQGKAFAPALTLSYLYVLARLKSLVSLDLCPFLALAPQCLS
jgi:hypothetical protein